MVVRDYQVGGSSLAKIAQKYELRNKSQLTNWIKIYNTHGNFKSESGRSDVSQTKKFSLEERVEIVLYCIAHDHDYSATAVKYQVKYANLYQWVKRYEEKGNVELEDRRGRRKAQQVSRMPEEEAQIKTAQLEVQLKYQQMEIDLLKKVKEIEKKGSLGQVRKIVAYESIKELHKEKGYAILPVNREFTADALNQKWLTDVTEFKYYIGAEVKKVYLSAILDLYDRRIVSYVIRDTNDLQLVFDTFDLAVFLEPETHPLFHSDCGFQYIHVNFYKRIVEAGMTQSMSRVGKCIDNEPMGRLFSSRVYIQR